MRFKLLLLVSALMLFVSSASYSQILSPGSTNLESWGQMLNTSNLYYISATQSIVTPGINGTQSDTVTGSTYFTVIRLQTGKVAVDTLTPNTLNGEGKVSFTAYVWHASTTSTLNPVCTLTLEKAYQDIKQGAYTAVAGATVFTLTPTFSANKLSQVPLTCSWDLTSMQGRFWNVLATCTTDTAVIKVGYYTQKPRSYQILTK